MKMNRCFPLVIPARDSATAQEIQITGATIHARIVNAQKRASVSSDRDRLIKVSGNCTTTNKQRKSLIAKRTGARRSLAARSIGPSIHFPTA
jgi:hypothetical protein